MSIDQLHARTSQAEEEILGSLQRWQKDTGLNADSIELGLAVRTYMLSKAQPQVQPVLFVRINATLPRNQ